MDDIFDSIVDNSVPEEQGDDVNTWAIRSLGIISEIVNRGEETGLSEEMLSILHALVLRAPVNLVLATVITKIALTANPPEDDFNL